MKLWYLATPYALYPEGHEAAYQAALAQAAFLTSHGIAVFSPIVHSHPIHQFAPQAGDFWLSIDDLILESCFGALFCKLPSWPTSKGMKEELNWCEIKRKPHYWMDPFTLPAPLTILT